FPTEGSSRTASEMGSPFCREQRFSEADVRFGSKADIGACPPTADIGTQPWNVRFVPKADIGLGLHDGQKCHITRLTSRFVVTCPSVPPIVRASRSPRMDPQNTVFPVQPCRR